MKKQEKIQAAKENFLNCTGTLLEKSKLAKIYLETVNTHGSSELVFRSKTWKENRDKKLKSCCETCGSTDGLHISHIWHPPKGEAMKRHVYQVHGAAIKSKQKLTVERDACPVCNSTGAVKFLKTLGKFKCYAKKTAFKPHIQDKLDEWEQTKNNDGVRESYYRKLLVSSDQEVRFKITGMDFKIHKKPCDASGSKAKLEYLKKQYLLSKEYPELVIDDNQTYSIRPTPEYFYNRHKVECNAVFETPSKKIVEVKKRDNYRHIYRYYYALEHIALSERYIEMRDEDILTECKKCGFERDKKVIEEKKSLSVLEALKQRYQNLQEDK